MSGNIQVHLPADAPDWAVTAFRTMIQQVQASYGGPQRLSSYTVATLPTASKWLNCAIIVSNESGGRTIATSDGTNWKRVKDGATVS